MTEIEVAVQAERDRCAKIVQLARAGEIDTDWRSVIFLIKSGTSIEDIKDNK